MKFPKIMPAGIIVVLFLAACASTQAPVKYSLADPASTGCSTPEGPDGGKIGTCKVNVTSDPTAAPVKSAGAQSDSPVTDTQGAVTIEVKPLNLDDPGDTLTFEVSMNTHSVDLSMNLAALASLTTDNSLTIQASQWDAPQGGHHVSGKLTFPITSDGISLLKSAKELTLTIKDVDAPARKFTWQLAQ